MVSPVLNDGGAAWAWKTLESSQRNIRPRCLVWQNGLPVCVSFKSIQLHHQAPFNRMMFLLEKKTIKPWNLTILWFQGDFRSKTDKNYHQTIAETWCNVNIWGFHKWGCPKWIVYFMENHIKKGTPISGNLQSLHWGPTPKRMWPHRSTTWMRRRRFSSPCPMFLTLEPGRVPSIAGFVTYFLTPKSG